VIPLLLTIIYFREMLSQHKYVDSNLALDRKLVYHNQHPMVIVQTSRLQALEVFLNNQTQILPFLQKFSSWHQSSLYTPRNCNGKSVEIFSLFLEICFIYIYFNLYDFISRHSSSQFSQEAVFVR